MKGKWMLVSMLIVGLMLVLGTEVSLAQGPGSEEGIAPQAAVGTAFTYQGRLTDLSGNPVSSTCDLRFNLYGAASGGAPLGSVNRTGVTVSNGLFTVPLDFGSSAFSGSARYLEVAVCCPSGACTFVTLSPRQELTPTPYALYARSAPCWSLRGDGGTNPSTNFMGTTNNQALELRVNNARALRLEPAANSPNLIGGYSGNAITSSVYGAVIGGGGASATENRVTDNYGTVSGGVGNQAGDGAGTTSGKAYATVGGGYQNKASGADATVSGGIQNTASGADATVGGGNTSSASGYAATVGGGDHNTASAWVATVGGGSTNTAGSGATVGGGDHNTASGYAATVSGGDHNTASAYAASVGGGGSNTASGGSSAVGGGYHNIASGTNATVPGGEDNIAQGSHSFAAGNQAKANNKGCFVWADSTYTDVTCNADNRTIFRSSGGFYIYTNADLSSGVYVPAGGQAWSITSDRNLKGNFAPVNAQELLARLAQVPITTWNYRSQAPSIRHIGPMAQDFYVAFGVGEDNTHISTVDADGVALAAIQGLYAQNQALQAENAAQQTQIAALEARLAALEEAVGPRQRWGGGQ